MRWLLWEQVRLTIQLLSGLLGPGSSSRAETDPSVCSFWAFADRSCAVIIGAGKAGALKV